MQPATPTAKAPSSKRLHNRARLIERIGERAANLFRTRQLWCSEAVLSVVNRSLGGDLPDDLALRLGAGLGEGIGGSGCACGALTGGALAIGLFCGTAGTGLHRSRGARERSRRLHDWFKARYGSTCCRVLTKALVQGTEAHFDRCAEKVAGTAAMTAELILETQPDLLARADWDYLNQKDGRLKARLKMVGDLLGRASNAR
jgi:C_GCAxxG_C_C family probable redox protein